MLATIHVSTFDPSPKSRYVHGGNAARIGNPGCTVYSVCGAVLLQGRFTIANVEEN